jgi:hypothetical protein
MTARQGLLNLLPFVPIILAHLVGVVVAVILLTRKKSQAAILALAGFGVLFVVDLAQLGRAPLVGVLVDNIGGIRSFMTLNTSLGCCCSVLDVIAVACLIVALWKAVAAPEPDAPAEAPEEIA